MFQGGPPHEPYFIAIDNREQVIIGPSKKMVAIYVVGELEVLIWFMGTWMLKWRYCYDQYLLDATWIWAKGNDDMISCTACSSVSASCSRCNIFALSLYTMTCSASCILNIILIAYQYIKCRYYSMFSMLYQLNHSHSFLKSLPKLQPEPSLRS